jgi:hypothetical protein
MAASTVPVPETSSSFPEKTNFFNLFNDAVIISALLRLEVNVRIHPTFKEVKMLQVETEVTVPHTKAPCCKEPQSDSNHEAHAAHHEHAHHHEHGAHGSASLNRTAFMATIHCLTGCTIGEVLGLVMGTAFGWSNWPTVALAVVLAFFFGYAMTLWPLRSTGMAWGTAFGLAFASDTLSMATMELVDNALMVADPLFWGSLTVAMVVAGIAAFPVNRWLIGQGKGHPLVHAHHRQKQLAAATILLLMVTALPAVLSRDGSSNRRSHPFTRSVTTPSNDYTR